MSQVTNAGNIWQPHIKNEIRTFSNTIHKNKLKMGYRPGYYKTPGGKHRENALWHKL